MSRVCPEPTVTGPLTMTGLSERVHVFTGRGRGPPATIRTSQSPLATAATENSDVLPLESVTEATIGVPFAIPRADAAPRSTNFEPAVKSDARKVSTFR